MHKEEKAGRLKMQVSEELSVELMPIDDYGFIMTSKEVANGYDCTKDAIRKAMQRNGEDFQEGKHFVKGVTIRPTLGKFFNFQPNQIYLTKRGIVRLGFFLKCGRAKLFRDWAEDLIIKVDERRDLFGRIMTSAPKEIGKRNHNRLTQARLVDILADVAKIDDKAIRLSLIQKLGL